MGLNIKDIVSKKELEILELKGKTLCVDAFNTIYQFLSSIRQPDGTPLMDSNQKITSHLSGIFYRNLALLKEGIKLIYIFDGKAPELKKATQEKRKAIKEEALEKYQSAKEQEDYEEMKKYSSQLSFLDEEMLNESKELLTAMGICIVQAPSEGEAQASYLVKTNKELYATVSQDYDSLLFGTPILIRNLTISRKRKTLTGYTEILPEKIILKEFLEENEINQDQLICLGILVGTDYNPKGIPGIGQKKALKLVQELKEPEKIFESVKEKIEELNEEKFDWKEIFKIFKNHPAKEEEIKFPEIDYEKIKEILIQRHEFSNERIEKQIENLKEIEKRKNQKSLNKWF
jgi:flap endonuclease-1